MKSKALLVLSASALAVAVSAAPAGAAPNDNSCHGQSLAGLTYQFGNAAAAAAAYGVSVQEGQIMVREFCASGTQ